MLLTNKYEYPACVVAMAQAALQRPDSRVMRVTSLIAPPAIRHYQLTDWDNIEVDVNEFVISSFGTAWHHHLASFSSEIPGNVCSEQTLQIEHNGTVLSGTPDIRTADVIDDYKVTSAWSFLFAKPEWEQQLNVYALLAEANGFVVSKLHINAFLRDWSALNAMRYSPDYPDRPFYRAVIPLWPIEGRRAFVEQRFADHEAGLRPCTPKERWQRENTWAVMKPGRKTAVRVLSSEGDAETWLSHNPTKAPRGYIEYRPGSCRRCEEYCFVRSVCQFRTTYEHVQD